MCRSCRLLVAAGLGLLLGAAAAVSGAAPPLLGSNIRIGSASANENSPAVAWNGTNGEYLVVWERYAGWETRGWDIYARRLGADGAPLGRSVRISGPAATSNEYGPAVAWSAGSGVYLIVWHDLRNDATRGWDIYGQFVGADGLPVGPNFRISGPDAVAEEYQPTVVWNPADGEYLVAWEDTRDAASRGRDIYGQRLAADGSRMGGDFRISGAAATESETTPAAAWSQEAGGYLVIWQDARHGASAGYGVYGQRLAADGSRVGGNFRISGIGTAEEEGVPAVAWSQAGGAYLVVWPDVRHLATRGWDIFGQRVGADGSLLGGSFRVSGSAATANEGNPAVVSNEQDGGYFVVWQDGRNHSARGSEIFGQRLTGAGEPDGANSLISRAVTDEYAPALAWNQAANQHLVVWDDDRNYAARSTDIYGQRVAG